MKFKQLGISALALGLVVGGGVTISAFASANSEENPKGTVYKDKIDLNGTDKLSFDTIDKDNLPEGTVYKDEIKVHEQ